MDPSLGSARAIFQKARIEKNWQNEPIDSTHQDKPICTLEYMVWPIRTGRNLLLKLNLDHFFLYNSPRGLFFVKNTRFSAMNDTYSL